MKARKVAKLQSDPINGPHAVLDGTLSGQSGEGVTLTVRCFHAGPGKVALTAKDGRRSIVSIVDAAELIETVRALVPAAVN